MSSPTSWPTSGSAMPSRRPTGATSGSTSGSPPTASGCGSTTSALPSWTQDDADLARASSAGESTASRARHLFGFGATTAARSCSTPCDGSSATSVLRDAPAVGARTAACPARPRTPSLCPTRSPVPTSTFFDDLALLRDLPADLPHLTRAASLDAVSWPRSRPAAPASGCAPASRASAASARPAARRAVLTPSQRSGSGSHRRRPVADPRQVDELAVAAEDQVGHRPAGEVGRRHAVAHVPSGPAMPVARSKRTVQCQSRGTPSGPPQWKGNGDLGEHREQLAHRVDEHRRAPARRCRTGARCATRSGTARPGRRTPADRPRSAARR